jgi:integrin beta 2
MLAEDGASCREYAGYLLYSERTILKSIHLSDERNLNAPVQPFEDPEHMKNVIALAFDYRAGTSPGTPNRIFFSDIHFGNIQQINDDGTGRITIVESKPNPQTLCLPRKWEWGVGEGVSAQTLQHQPPTPALALNPPPAGP